MSRYSEITPIRDKDQEIPGAWLYPHYTDERFTEIGTEGRTIFLAKTAIAVPGAFGNELVKGAFYNYSDRIYQGFDHELVERARAEAEQQTGGKNTASYFEAMLQKIYEDPSVLLQHMIAGVNRSNGFPYQIYGTFDSSTSQP